MIVAAFLFVLGLVLQEKSASRLRQLCASQPLRRAVSGGFQRFDACGSVRRRNPLLVRVSLNGAAQESNLPSDGLRRLTGFEGLQEGGR